MTVVSVSVLGGAGIAIAVIVFTLLLVVPLGYAWHRTLPGICEQVERRRRGYLPPGAGIDRWFARGSEPMPVTKPSKERGAPPAGAELEQLGKPADEKQDP